MATSNVDQQNPLEALSDLLGRDGEDGPSMSLVDHLEELRWRLFKSVITIVVATIIAFIFRDYIIHFLEIPLPKEANALDHGVGGKLVVTGLTEGFTVYLLLSFALGVVVVLPVLLYQTWAFIA